MINELAWRKFPRDTMRNEDLDYVSYLLGPEKAALPFLFYTTAFCKCDDDGVFDIEDGVIFSRLMRLGAPDDVLAVASMLCDRKIITRVVEDQNVFMITDWEAPQRPGNYGKKSLTAEERRAAIAAKIHAEQAHKNKPVTQPKTIPVVTYDQIKAPDFFCPEFDKNEKNVETQREIERGYREDRDKDTHTQREDSEQTDRDTREMRDRSNSLAGFTTDPAATVAEGNQEELRNQKNENQNESLAAMALTETNGIVKGNSVNDEINKGQVYRQLSSTKQVFSEFFTKNCIGYKATDHETELQRLAERMIELSSSANPPEIIASVFCSQFQALREKSEYYATVPLTSTHLLKPNTYAAVCTNVSKVLNTKGANEKWQQQMNRERLEAEANKPLVYDQIQKDCLEYGIDFKQEGALSAVLMARRAQGNK